METKIDLSQKGFKNVWQPLSLFSLFDVIKEILPSELAKLLAAFYAIEDCMNKMNAREKFNVEICESIKPYLDIIEETLDWLEDEELFGSFHNIAIAITENKYKGQVMSSLVEDLRSSVFYRLRSSKAYVLLPESCKYVNESYLKKLFNDGMIFKKAYRHLNEAQLCLAFNRSTASVYHSICALDFALPKIRRLTEKYTGDKIPKETIEKSWGVILNCLRAKIDAAMKNSKTSRSNRKTLKLQEIGELRSRMSDIQFSKRDDTFHARAQHGFEEAERVFRTTCNLIAYLDTLR